MVDLNKSTVSVPLGLDVLDALTEMATPSNQGEFTMLTIARNVAREAYVNAPRTLEETMDFTDFPVPRTWTRYYETEGMAEVRKILTNDKLSNEDVDTFKRCLAALEKHNFTLSRTFES